MDTGVSRTAASSCAAAASLALLALGRFVAGCIAFAALTGSARAAEEVEDFFPTAGMTLAADVFLAEEANLASVTFLVGSFELVPGAFFPPVVPPEVFAIASPFRLC
ncbi:hypothetical protein [Paraburkholderia sp. SIMBA_030]|uniref:hypothetical protein n=1 Tax=Paraburkholderia sp. SIMBA_030 TaxID=3085773 RepID=UPI00397B8623